MKSNLKINCGTCLKRLSCTELCERAREYADQDYVSLKEKVLGKPPAFGTWAELDRYVVGDGIVLNDRQLCVMVLVSSGVPRKVIKHGMKITAKELSESVYRIKQKQLKNKREDG